MTKRSFALYLTFAGLILAAAIGLKVAEHTGILGADSAQRSAQIFIGLFLALYANFIPKRLSALRSAEAEWRKQTALRVSGWSFSLAGLAYAAVWIFAPQSLAFPLAISIVASAVALNLGLAIWACSARASIPG